MILNISTMLISPSGTSNTCTKHNPHMNIWSGNTQRAQIQKQFIHFLSSVSLCACLLVQTRTACLHYVAVRVCVRTVINEPLLIVYWSNLLRQSLVCSGLSPCGRQGQANPGLFKGWALAWLIFTHTASYSFYWSNMCVCVCQGRWGGGHRGRFSCYLLLHT